MKEVILCTNPNLEGEATAMYLARLLGPLGVRVTRIASGLPVGGDLEYADELTLGRALEGRREPVNLWILRHAKTVPDPPPGKTGPRAAAGAPGPAGRRRPGARGWAGPPGFGPGEPARRSCCAPPPPAPCRRPSGSWRRCDRPPAVDYRRALYGASPDEVLDELRGVEDGVGTVMVVGHNPTAQDLVAAMGTGPAPGGGAFPTCALAVYGLPVESWSEVALGTGTLLGLFTPPY